MIASLPMYFRPETTAAYNNLWQHIRANLQGRSIAAPKTLQEPYNLLEHWRDPNLLLSQTCGLPLELFLRECVYLVGTTDAGHMNCPTGHYFSYWIKAQSDSRAKPEDFQGATLSFNDKFSRSGWELPQLAAKKRGVHFSSTLECGSHLLAAKAIVARKSEIAAIDAHSWNLMVQFDGFAAELCAFDKTGNTPGLPLITAQKELLEPLREAVVKAIESQSHSAKQLTGFRRLVAINKSDYFLESEIPN